MFSGQIFFQNLTTDPQFFWAVCITVIVSVCLHELSHGMAAIWLGDRTPIETGHMTLNPLKHMGGMSLILLLVAGIAWGAMPVNPRRMRGRFAPALVAAAGPACNVLLAIVSLGLLGLWQRQNQGGSDDPTGGIGSVQYFAWVFGSVNLVLAIFNLLPIPPLDGSRIAADFIPSYARLAEAMRAGGGASIVFLLVFLFAGRLIYPAADAVAGAMLTFARGY